MTNEVLWATPNAMSNYSSDGSNTPSPFDILFPDRQTVPLIFASPHSGRNYPPDFVAGSRLDPVSLRRSEDSFVDDLFAASPDFGAPLLRALFPRAFIDPNREPFELDQSMFSDKLPDYVNTESSRVAAGLGTIARVVSSGQDIYPRKLTFAEAADRIDRYYRPYHKALENLIADTRRRFGYCVIVDCHSMPSIGGPLDPDAGRGRANFIIGDCFGSACAPYITDAVERTISGFGYGVARNKPFAGGFTTRHYGQPRDGVHAVQIEINRGLYMNEINIEKNGSFDRIAAQMTDVIAALARLTAQDLAAE
ncbi:MAG: N-formylglutamate amidohydrolase [Pseudomonadota bacterium]|nr:N-formylglutamate amidohydrolase [Pseudomonadota bacterium]